LVTVWSFVSLEPDGQLGSCNLHLRISLFCRKINGLWGQLFKCNESYWFFRSDKMMNRCIGLKRFLWCSTGNLIWVAIWSRKAKDCVRLHCDPWILDLTCTMKFRVYLPNHHLQKHRANIRKRLTTANANKVIYSFVAGRMYLTHKKTKREKSRRFADYSYTVTISVHTYFLTHHAKSFSALIFIFLLYECSSYLQRRVEGKLESLLPRMMPTEQEILSSCKILWNPNVMTEDPLHAHQLILRCPDQL
jgi:hypothetical protein